MSFAEDSASSPPGLYLKNVPLVFGDSWLLPIYNMKDTREQFSQIATSKDFGTTWTTADIPNSDNRVQASLIVSPSTQEVKAYFRDREERHIYSARVTSDVSTLSAHDSPRSIEWSRCSETRMPNRDSAVLGLWLRSGRVLVAYDDTNDEDRYPLNLVLSDDGGDSFSHSRILEDKDTSPLSDGADLHELSYPSVVQTDDGALHVVITFNRVAIKYFKISENWIINGNV
jgi:predicted neuraminidase